MLQQFYPIAPHDYAFELNKDMHFAAAHFLPNEKAGKCSQTHGHTYFVNITIIGDELDELGMLVNFADLKKLIHGKMDHSLLNDRMNMPSTENVAKFIFEVIEYYLGQQTNKTKILQIIVRETPTSYVIYKGER